MSLINTQSYIVHLLLTFISEKDVLRFNEAFPELEDVVNLYWSNKNVLNIDKISYTDMGVILDEVIKRCANLKKVKSTLPRYKTLHDFFPFIINYCPRLEVLDIPKIVLSESQLSSFSSCVNLKSLNASFEGETNNDTLWNEFYVNKRLESLSIHGLRFKVTSFRHLPRTIKKLELEVHCPKDLEGPWDGINGLELEKLHLSGNPLSREVLTAISKQCTLKSLKISFNYKNNDVLETLFLNNTNLEELYVDTLSVTCLQYLPNTIKKLHLKHIVNFTVFYQCLDRCDLEALTLSLSVIPKSLGFVILGVSGLKHLKLNCLFIPQGELKYIRELKHLRTLCLEEVHCREDLQIVVEQCHNVEELELIKFHLPFPAFQLFAAIAAIPALKSLYMRFCTHMTDYSWPAQFLARSPSLSSIGFIDCDGFDDVASLLLITGCKTLKNLEISGDYYSEDLIPAVTSQLALQKNRKNALLLQLKTTVFSAENIPDEISHPLLEVII